MLDVTFKEVGNGDSIILQWINDEGYEELGIIDCNLKPGNENPVLEELQALSSNEIHFVVLSHPHYDHYSGLRQIFEYCENNGIPIKSFLHTAKQVPEFLKTAVKTMEAKKELEALFKKVRELKAINLIGHFSYIDFDRRDLKLNSKLSIRFLAPSPEEDENYLREAKLFSEEQFHNNPNANWLSSVLKVYTKDWYVLLTADAERPVLKKLGKKHQEKEFSEALSLGQAPHHGSLNNHYKAFWQHRIGDSKNIPVVFSVGENPYSHPSEKAISDFQKLGYDIYATNQVGSLKGLNDGENQFIEETEALLDLTSEGIPSQNSEFRFQGDQVFEVDKYGNIDSKH